MIRLSASTIMFAGLYLFADGSALHSQETPRPTARRIPVTVALSPVALPSGEMFLIRRNPKNTRGDVILLAPDASAIELAEAVRTLLQVRRLNGDVGDASATLRLRPGQPRHSASTRMAWTGRVVRDLRRAEHQDIHGIGRARALRIWLPSQNASR